MQKLYKIPVGLTKKLLFTNFKLSLSYISEYIKLFKNEKILVFLVLKINLKKEGTRYQVLGCTQHEKIFACLMKKFEF